MIRKTIYVLLIAISLSSCITTSAIIAAKKTKNKKSSDKETESVIQEEKTKDPETTDTDKEEN